MSRLVKVLPDTGSLLKFNAPDDINVEQLMALIEENGGSLDLSKNLLTEKVTKATFLTGDAIIPNGDVTFFTTLKDPKGNLTASKSSSYKTLSRSECYSEIAKFKKRDGDRAVAYFYGFTTMKTSILEGKIKMYSKKSPALKTKAGKLPPVTKVNASKASKTTKSAPKKVNREEAELRAARKSFKGNIYNKK
jgi:hypothetical protein